MRTPRLARPPAFWHGPAMKPSRAWLTLVSVLTLTLGAPSLAGCGGAAPPKKTAARPVRAKKPKAPEAPKPAPIPLLPAYVVAELADESATPYFARGGRGGNEGLLLYSASGRWKSRLVAADGKPLNNETIDVAPVAANVAIAALRAAGDGYLAAWVEPVAKNSAIKLLALDATGKALGPPALVLQATDEVAWLEILPNETKGALLLWETTRDETSDLTVVPVVGGKASGTPRAVVQGALQWEAAATAKGAAIGFVQAPPGGGDAKDDDEGSKTGRVLLVEVDAKGAPGTPVVVSQEPTAHADLELVEVAGKHLLAWTDERSLDANVMLAVVAPGGSIVSPPRKATAPLGEQALVALVSAQVGPGEPPSERALLAWEDLLAAPREGRVIRLATVGADGSVSKDRASMVLTASSGAPDLAAAKDGFAAVTLAPASLVGAKPNEAAGGDMAAKTEAPAEEPHVWPTFVRFGPDLRVLSAEPIRSEPFAGSPTDPYLPYLVRGLSCHGETCTALALGAGTPMPLAIVPLPVRESRWQPPARREPEEQPPRATGAVALYAGDHMSEVASAEFPGGGSLVAWVTYHLEPPEGEPKGKGDEPLATLGVRSVGAQGELGKPVVLSKRAVSIGGVALSAAPAPKDAKGAKGKLEEAALAWVAREKNGEAQVFVTKVSPSGEKLAQKKLTVVPRKKREGVPSESSDVAIAYAPSMPAAEGAKGPVTAADTGDGWIVAWVDTRDGNAEVYVAKVDRTLKKVVPDRRVTTAPGDSAEVQIAVRGREAWLVWSDARASADEGTGDIYLARLDARTLAKAGEETRLFASASHSRSPVFAASPDGLMVAWIEESLGADKQGSGEAGVRLAQLDDKGAVRGAPVLVRGEGGASVSSVALLCGAGRGLCRGVLTSAVGEAQVLGAFEVSPGAPAGPLKTLAALGGGTTQDVSPSLSGASASSLFFADNAVNGAGRVRWMTLAWP